MLQESASFAQFPSFRTIIRGLMPSILVNAVLPYVIYTFLKSNTSTSDLIALLISGIPSLLYEVVTITRQRQTDLLGLAALAFVIVSAGVSLLGGDAKLLLIRESFFTVIFGGACIISLLFPKPLWFFIIRYFATANTTVSASTFNTRWQYPAFRRYIRIITVVWGVIYLVEFPVRVILVYNLSIQQSLAISSIIFYVVTTAVIAFTIAYARYTIRLITSTQQAENGFVENKA